ncbi:hypothetical protein GS496_20790 [Rhodococcus hoagii]|nr:hypothetical protein [Prescottella equi]NKS42860.1 hypothetical protein [Prescottella equi]
MRWVRSRMSNDERGVVAVLVAILMVVLLGCAAISVDIGANYVVKRQLQNGADAAALAVAQESSCKAGSSASSVSSLVQANVNSSSASSAAVIDGVKRKVTVTASAVGDDGLAGRKNVFAPVLGVDRSEISASATASCVFPLGGTAELPLTFHKCHFDESRSLDVKILVAYNVTAPRCNGTSGNAAPGNFGWLQGANGRCPAKIDAAVYATPGDTGNNIPGPCKDTIKQFQNAVVRVPIYDVAGGTGSGGWFHVVGLAAFKIQGYRLSGNPEFNWNNDVHGALSCTGSCRGIIGTFVKVVSLDSDLTPGGIDFGVSTISLLD